MDNSDLAELISLVFSAPLFAIYLLIIILMIKPDSSLLYLIIKFILGFIFLGVLPTTPILIAVRSGETDIFVFEREKRFRFFAIAIASYSIGSLLFLLIKDYELSIFLACYATVTSGIALSTVFTKTSVHTAGIAGPVTFMIMIFGLWFSLLYLLLIPVSWARWVSRAHTWRQLLLGVIISIVITVLTVHLIFSALGI